MKKRIILFAVLLIPISIMAQDFSSPERTLDTYFYALKSGNKSQVLNCFHPKLNDFYLPEPVPIKSYKIMKKIVYTKKETEDWNSKGIIPSAELGDIDIQVEQESFQKNTYTPIY